MDEISWPIVLVGTVLLVAALVGLYLLGNTSGTDPNTSGAKGQGPRTCQPWVAAKYRSTQDCAELDSGDSSCMWGCSQVMVDCTGMDVSGSGTKLVKSADECSASAGKTTPWLYCPDGKNTKMSNAKIKDTDTQLCGTTPA